MRIHRAFSLVEVLLAILILALGLLGLGAVIPVIVKQQRTATDLTLGVTAARDAEAALLSRPAFTPSSVTGVSAWDHLLADTQNWSSAGNSGVDHLWQPWETRGRNTINLDTGDLLFNNQSGSPGTRVILHMKDRLWPNESMQVVEREPAGEDRYRPQFVWDFVGRRVRTGAAEPPAIQVALFVRRIDVNIRVPRQGAGRFPPTLLDVLTGANVLDIDRCVPVAVVNSGDPTPTNRGNTSQGNRTYANFLTLDATFTIGQRDRIILSRGGLSSPYNDETLFTLASQPNQTLVDNFGNIYRVLRLDEEQSGGGGVTVVVTPSIPPSVPDTSPPNATDEFRQVVFTPQVPGAVRVFTVTRPIK